MNSLFNLLIICTILLAIVLFVLYRMLTMGKQGIAKEAVEKELYSLKNVQSNIQNEISNKTSINLYNQGYTPDEFEKEARRLNELKDALRNCNTGDHSSKTYVLEYMYDILKKLIQYDENTINFTLPFNTPAQLTVKERFDILLHLYSQKHGKKGFGLMLEEYGLNKPREDGSYYVDKNDIDIIFKEQVRNISFEDKLRIITQRIYSQYKGLGVIDAIADMSIDGVSGGLSGLPNKAENMDDDELIINRSKDSSNGLDSIWVMFQGNSIHLRFLEFESEAELRRVVQNVYKYNAPGQLSETRPYIINERADGSRVTVARPPFAIAWAFFIRKKYDSKKIELETLITGENAELAIDTVRFLMRGERTTGYTGAQGSGKTTLLTSAIGEIHPARNIRTVETAFELNLRSIYPKRNTLSFQETGNITGQDALDFQKKTDGHVPILGEVATHEVASQMVQAAQVANMTLFTHHAKTADALIGAIANSLKQTGAFKDDIGAERQVAEVIEFNIHLKQDYDGTRYVERITEIIPIEAKQEDIEEINNIKDEDERLRKLQIIHLQKSINTKTFITKDIVVFRDGKYQSGEMITSKKIEEMKNQMSPEDTIAFDEMLAHWWRKAE